MVAYVSLIELALMTEKIMDVDEGYLELSLRATQP